MCIACIYVLLVQYIVREKMYEISVGLFIYFFVQHLFKLVGTCQQFCIRYAMILVKFLEWESKETVDSLFFHGRFFFCFSSHFEVIPTLPSSQYHTLTAASWSKTFENSWVTAAQPFHGKLCGVALIEQDRRWNPCAVYHCFVSSIPTGYWRNGRESFSTLTRQGFTISIHVYIHVQILSLHQILPSHPRICE